ncbi:DUF917 domain-containing protein [Cognatishimia sp. SS12]|uniref:DUF917 domain-containing protein n=1 Tax=Cognatishimia sp. SS12 TaxID=2979465 RepID=UPI0023314690|nr:DUF917 domain-containing protein [Cognatishimia sp. SS12]MDC0739575.1 DUF917 domain-containing protein [Cognatishimia sp. SS12]
MKKLTRQNLEDILYGATILGTGGGGELSTGFALIDDALAKGKSFTMVSLDEAPQDALVCTPYMLGAISPLPPEEEKKYARLPRIEEPSILAAYRRFESYLGRKFYGTISCELGGSNTATAFYAAAMSDAYIIDADPAGRAVPEITHSTYYINSLPAAPIVAANAFGETIICENVMDDERAEHIVRALSVVSRNDIAAIDHALEVKDIKHAVIPGAISMAMRMGEAWRLAKEAGADIPDVIAKEGKGAVVFRGVVGENAWKTEEGFTIGDITIAGSDANDGDTYKIWLKNENMIGWVNGEVHATIPDLICLIDTETGAPITNPNYYTGQKVAVVVLPAPEPFTTPKGLAAFGPAYAGLDQPYRPAIS